MDYDGEDIFLSTCPLAMMLSTKSWVLTISKLTLYLLSLNLECVYYQQRSISATFQGPAQMPPSEDAFHDCISCPQHTQLEFCLLCPSVISFILPLQVICLYILLRLKAATMSCSESATEQGTSVQ